MSQDDQILLQEFAANRSEAAFNALVSRYLPLVHSAALRHTCGNVHQAEEISQSVFILLARKANSMGSKTVLTGWLYRTTHYIAAASQRQYIRRQLREQQAYMESTLTPHEDTDDVWQQIAPVLDEEMNTLKTADRDAVLLRYFENKSLAEVGTALGVSEDAARVRVNRALEKLRTLLSKRGITLGGTTIAGAMTTHAVQAVPTAMAAAITTTALKTGSTTLIAAVTMTTFQKITVTAAVTLTLGVGLYEAGQVQNANAQSQRIITQQAQLTEEAGLLSQKLAKASNTLEQLNLALAGNEKNDNELLRLRGHVSSLQNTLHEARHTGSNTTADSMSVSAQAWAERVKTLKERFSKWPGKSSPELQLLTEKDWLDNTAVHMLDSEGSCRSAMGELRETAQKKLSTLVNEALQAYFKEHGETLPTDVSQLKPYLNSPANSILDDYEIAKPGWVKAPHSDSTLGKGNEPWALIMKGSFTANGTPIHNGSYLSDPEYDLPLIIYDGGYFMYGTPKRVK